MPFLGNKPTNNFTSFEKQDITGDGSSSYTLAHAVNNEKDIDLFINFVHQEPTTAFQASGTTLTLTESISSADDCYILFRSRAILSATPPDGSVSSAKIASGAVTSAKLATNIQADTLYGKTTDGDSGIDLSTNDVVKVKIAGSEKVRVDANGSVGVSVTPSAWDTSANGRTPVQVNFGSISGRSSDLQSEISNNCYSSGTGNSPQWSGITRYAKTQMEMYGDGSIRFKNASTVDQSTFDSSPNFTFSERGRWDASGNFLVANTDNSSDSLGVKLRSSGQILQKADGTTCLLVNRGSDDGTIISIRQDNAQEGTISSSGSTISYNGFCGLHESSGIASDTPVGTVCSTIDELDTYPDTQDGADHPKKGKTRADHAKVKVSDSSGDKRIYGVLQRFDPENGNKPMIASVGIGSVRVTGACSGGDLLESNGDGTAKVQSDDIVKSKTIGKVTIGNSSTDVKLVSCVLYCG